MCYIDVMAGKYTYFIGISLLITCLHINKVSADRCYYKRCIGCEHESLTDLGSDVQCNLGNMVTPRWLHDLSYITPANTNNVPIAYRCLKMTATPDDKTWGRTTDIIRGCIPDPMAEGICNSLTAMQRARGYSDVRCVLCWGNLCNAATTIKTQLFTIFVSVSMALLFGKIRPR